MIFVTIIWWLFSLCQRVNQLRAEITLHTDIGDSIGDGGAGGVTRYGFQWTRMIIRWWLRWWWRWWRWRWCWFLCNRHWQKLFSSLSFLESSFSCFLVVCSLIFTCFCLFSPYSLKLMCIKLIVFMWKYEWANKRNKSAGNNCKILR